MSDVSIHTSSASLHNFGTALWANALLGSIRPGDDELSLDCCIPHWGLTPGDRCTL